MSSSSDDFDELLLDSIEETLQLLFGKGATFIIENIEKNSGVGSRELSKRPALLSNGLERIMGRAARNIERLIVKDITSKLGVDVPHSETESFADVVATVKARALQGKSRDDIP